MADRNFNITIGPPSITEVDYVIDRDSIRLGLIIPLIEDNSTIGGINGTIVLDDIADRLGPHYNDQTLNDLFNALKQRQHADEKYGFFVLDRIVFNTADHDHGSIRFKDIQCLIPPLLSDAFNIQISFMLNVGDL